jgi:enolase
MSRISDAGLRMIYDSRGDPTVEARLVTESGTVAAAGAPSGASTGKHEVRAFPDGGVPEALRRFEESVRERLVGLAVENQGSVDQMLHEVDGSVNLGRIGGNTATAVSVAVAIAHAAEHKTPLWRTLQRPGVDGRRYPAIVGNCLNGGRHAVGGPDIQEFLAISEGATPADSIRAALEVHHRLGRQLHARLPKAAIGRGDEGGWVVPLGNLEALELLASVCAEVRDATGIPVAPGLDLAASEFYRDGQYRYKEQSLSADGQLGFVTKLVEKYGLRYVEDPFDEEDFASFAQLTRALGSKTLVVGDDLYCTSLARVDEGIRHASTNAVLIKVNQVGTLSDTIRTVDQTRAHGWSPVTSHRSGEVPEGWLAHLAVAFGSAGIKCGLLGGERVAKLNELLRLAAPAGA